MKIFVVQLYVSFFHCFIYFHGKTSWKKRFGRVKRNWSGNINIGFRETGSEDDK
jgi:hypothetical protein